MSDLITVVNYDIFFCSSGKLVPHKWENCMTIDKYSWGYRRNAQQTDYVTMVELLTEMVTTVRYLSHNVCWSGKSGASVTTYLDFNNQTKIFEYVKSQYRIVVSGTISNLLIQNICLGKL